MCKTAWHAHMHSSEISDIAHTPREGPPQKEEETSCFILDISSGQFEKYSIYSSEGLLEIKFQQPYPVSHLMVYSYGDLWSFPIYSQGCLNDVPLTDLLSFSK